jgi:hypothetical protein
MYVADSNRSGAVYHHIAGPNATFSVERLVLL